MLVIQSYTVDNENAEPIPLEDYPFNISHISPSDALNKHKLIVLNHSKMQEIHINRNSESILRDVFKKMKRGEVDAKVMVDITLNVVRQLVFLNTSYVNIF